MQHQLAEANLVTISQKAGLVSHKALPVQKRAVGAVQIDEGEYIIPAPERCVHP